MPVKALRPLLVLVALLGILGFFASTQATIAHAMPPPVSLVVTKTADTNDGTCDADCSLREAITAANANTPLAETITFSIPGTDPNCSAANICTITLGSTLPGINDDLTIDGSANSGDITLSGNNAAQLLAVLSGKTLSLNTLTIANGNCPVAGCGGVGGGIISIGTLNIANSTFKGNNSALFGGGIYNGTGGTLNIANSTFSGNSAASNGGGIFNNTGGTVNIANSTLYGNTATGHGGGIVNFGTVDLRNSILTGNTAGAGTNDCANSATLNGSNNLIDGTTCGASAGRIGAVTNFDTTLNDNGGPTETHKLNGGSNALEAVPAGQCTYVSSGTNPLFTNAATIATDQRGVIRPQNTTCDVGAYELLYCSPGSYDSGTNSCTLAPPGYYVNVSGAVAPIPCLPGSYQDLSGDISCKVADPGYFVPTAASISQTQCPSGSDSALGAVACYQTGPSFVVNDASDTDDTACDALPGDCTLREAINAANALAGADTITFNILDTGADCTSDNVCTITLSALNTLPAINDDVMINGAPNNGNITISGAYLYRVMMVNSGKTLGLNALTIANGYVFSGVAGGIWNYGTVNLTNSAFVTNYASSGGGGIFNEGGTVNIAGSTFNGNNGGSGGAVYNYGGTYNIANSTFSGNFANNGGAVFNFDTTANITNSTFSGNYANNGGVIYNLSGTLNLKNSILTNTSTGGDCFNGATITGSDNLIDDTTCGSSSSFRLGAVTGFDTTLNNNGGPTQTFKLNANSNAIGAVPPGQCTYVSNGTNPLFSNAAAITSDQRGETRPQGLFCDVGAYELVYTGFQTGPNFLVNSAADTNDNSCDTLGQGIGNKDCTLREAINAANALVGPDTITFNILDTGADCLSDNVCTITLGSMLPAIDDDVTIDGSANSADITVSGNNAVRVMRVNSDKTLSLETLTISDGLATDANGGGGGILNSGTLKIANSTFSGNDGGVDSVGGAIRTAGGSLEVVNSTFVDNSAVVGGGIFNSSQASVTNSTFVGNSAVNSGGGIYNQFVLSVTNSTFFENSAGSQGGGIFNNNSMFVTNSTLSGNISTFSGGGVYDNETMFLYNTIVANNTSGGDCGGTFVDGAYNLDSDGSCGLATQKTSAEIALGSLQNNGGPTDTMALGNSSVAIDAGDKNVCAAAVGSPNFGAGGLDQRGKVRNDLQCDIGAFEFVDTDGNTISKAWTTDSTHLTFGPTLADMLLNSGSPLTLVVKREDIPTATPPGTPPANALPFLWDATTKESPFSLTVTLCYNPSVLTGQNENTLHVWHYNGSTWDDLGGTLDTVTHAPYHCVTASTALTSLSPILLAPANTTAVDVTGVKGVINKKGNIVVKWRTTSESQIAGFNVYRKNGKGEWKQVNANFIQAKNAGSTEGNKYRFADKQVKQGKTYRYKIEVKYLDNHSEWTKIVQVKTP